MQMCMIIHCGASSVRTIRCKFFLPVKIRKRPAGFGKPPQQWRGQPEIVAMPLAKFLDACQHRLEPYRIGVEHGTSAPGRKPVAVQVDHVDIRGAQRNAFAQHVRAFVYQGENAAIDHLFPVMPPRLVPAEYGFGFVDTLDKYTHISYQADSARPFVNPYAALPSLHYGWAVLVGGVLFWTTRNWWLRTVGLLMPVLQFTAIVFTANHYILDAMAGLGTGLLGLLVAIALQRWGYAYLRRTLHRALPAPEG